MLRAGKLLFVLLVANMICWMPLGAKADDAKLIGMVVGRTGSVLHIGVPQPVREGTIFEVKPFESEPPIAEARVLSCTQERPFMALAKVVRGDSIMSVPTGVRAYADIGAIEGTEAPLPQPIMHTDSPDRDRFSLQAGAFYPSSAVIQSMTSDYWQSYRFAFSFIRMGRFETLLSAEYSKGSGTAFAEGGPVNHSMEIMPITVMERFRPFRLGNAHLFFGAGAGIYNIRTKDTFGADTLTSNQQEFGHEFAVGMESKHGWVIEARYRDIQNTDLKGYLVTIGSRF